MLIKKSRATEENNRRLAIKKKPFINMNGFVFTNHFKKCTEKVEPS